MKLSGVGTGAWCREEARQSSSLLALGCAGALPGVRQSHGRAGAEDDRIWLPFEQMALAAVWRTK